MKFKYLIIALDDDATPVGTNELAVANAAAADDWQLVVDVGAGTILGEPDPFSPEGQRLQTPIKQQEVWCIGGKY